MNFEELQNQWSAMKADSSELDLHSSTQKENIMDKIFQIETEANQNRRRTEWATIPVVGMCLLFIYLFTSESLIGSIGLLLAALAIIIMIWQMRSASIQFEGYDQNSVAFLKMAQQKLEKRIWLMNVLTPIYMLLMSGGIVMYLSHILRDESATFFWGAVASVVLYGVFIYFFARRKGKQWQREEVQPVLDRISVLLEQAS